MPDINPQILRQFPLFQDLPSGMLSKVAAIAREKHYRKHATIFVEGDKGDYVVLIISGIIKISRAATSGRVKTLALLRAKDFFGEMALFLPGRERSATAEALNECRLITIDEADFERLLKEIPQISLRIIQTLAHRLQDANRQIKSLTLGDSRSRLADLLLWMKDEFTQTSGTQPTINLTHQELADLAGLSRETTTRLLNSLESEGAVILKSRQVTLANLETLKKHTA